MGLVVVTAPTAEPVTLAELKLHLRHPGDPDEDALLAALITQARQVCEHETGRALMTQTLDYTLEAFPCGELVLPRPPLVSVTSVSYVDPDGATQMVAGADYLVDTASLRGRIVPAYGKTWPATRAQPNAVTVRLVAGYASANAVPQPLKYWMLLQCGHWYANREAAVERALSPTPFIDGLLAPYSVLEF